MSSTYTQWTLLSNPSVRVQSENVTRGHWKSRLSRLNRSRSREVAGQDEHFQEHRFAHRRLHCSRGHGGWPQIQELSTGLVLLIGNRFPQPFLLLPVLTQSFIREKIDRLDVSLDEEDKAGRSRRLPKSTTTIFPSKSTAISLVPSGSNCRELGQTGDCDVEAQSKESCSMLGFCSRPQIPLTS